MAHSCVPCSAQRLVNHRVGLFVRVPKRFWISAPIVNAYCSQLRIRSGLVPYQAPSSSARGLPPFSRSAHTPRPPAERQRQQPYQTVQQLVSNPTERPAHSSPAPGRSRRAHVTAHPSPVFVARPGQQTRHPSICSPKAVGWQKARKFRLNLHGLSAPHTSMPLYRGTVNYEGSSQTLKNVGRRPSPGAAIFRFCLFARARA